MRFLEFLLFVIIFGAVCLFLTNSTDGHNYHDRPPMEKAARNAPVLPSASPNLTSKPQNKGVALRCANMPVAYLLQLGDRNAA